MSHDLAISIATIYAVCCPLLRRRACHKLTLKQHKLLKPLSDIRKSIHGMRKRIEEDLESIAD